MFTPASPEMIRASFERSASEVNGGIRDMREAIRTKLTDVRRAFTPGDETAGHFLVEKNNEPAHKRKERERFAHNEPLVRKVVKAHARLLYKLAPRRDQWVGDRPQSRAQMARAIASGKAIEQDKTTLAVAQFYRDVYEAYPGLQLQAATMALRDESVAVKVVPKQRDDSLENAGDVYGVLLAPMPIEDALPILDDKGQVIATVETRYNGKEEHYRLWDGEGGFTWVDGNLDTIEGPDGTSGEEWPLDRAPFVYLNTGESFLPDVVGYQKAAINAENALNILVRMQAGAVPALEGKLINAPEQGKDGSKGVRMSMDYFVHHEIGGKLYYASPDAKISEARDVAAELLERGFKAGELNPGLMQGDFTNVQPTTLLVAMFETLGYRDELIPYATAFEDDLTCAIGAVGLAFAEDFELPTDWELPSRMGQRGKGVLDWDVKFPANPLAADQREDERVAREQVNDGKKLLIDYLAEFVYVNETPEELAEIIQSLEAENRQPDPQIPDFNLPDVTDA